MGVIRSLLARTSTRRGVVLLYHRVTSLTADPQLLAVSPSNFADHLAVLSQTYEATRLDQIQAEAPSSCRIAVTFDDGYADNAREALPLLEAADVPATVFVVAGKIGDTTEFWWDELEGILLGKTALPERLSVSVGSTERIWPIDGPKDQASWNVLFAGPSSARQNAYRDLCDVIRPLPEEERLAVMARIRAWAGTSEIGRPSGRTLDGRELAALAASDLIDIGAHTMTHPVLGRQPERVQEREIQGSKRRLEEVLGRPVRTFSYPFGGRTDYTKRTVQLVRGAGFSRACSNFPGVVRGRTSRYEIPRMIVRNWSGDEFARRLGEILGD